MIEVLLNCYRSNDNRWGVTNTLIRELRKKLGLSQNELSRLAGVKQSVLSYIENGKTKHPRIDTLAAIAAALGVSVNDLVSNEKKAG